MIKAMLGIYPILILVNSEKTEYSQIDGSQLLTGRDTGLCSASVRVK